MSRLQTFIGTGLIAMSWGLHGFAQRSAKPAFEVVSIKPNNSDSGGPSRLGLSVQPGGRYAATSVTVRELIRVAYGAPDPLQESRVIGGPRWLDSDRFDVVGKAPEGSRFQPVFPMLQSLLADRFMLVIKEETRELPIYALVTAGAGTLGRNLQPAADCTAAPPAERPPAEQSARRIVCGIDGSRPGQLVFSGMPISILASHPALARELHREVVDRTGLAGFFSGTLEWTPSVLAGRSPSSTPDAAPAATDGPSIFAAVQEQWGLKFEPVRGPVMVFVIESVEHPTSD